MVGSSYYKRVKEGDYPNAEEIDRLVEGLNLVDVGLTAGELKIRFGIVDPANIPAIKRELQDMEEYLRLNHPSTTMTRKEVIRRRGLARYRARPDAPPM
ncbi:hypothetical protein [Mycobacterium phage WXIN]|nr:hypothetical protein [Mycobacterium phage WXIN]